MDGRGQRFWLLAQREHWDFGAGAPRVAFDQERRVLHLSSRREPGAWREDPDEAERRLETLPMAVDGAGTRASWDPAASAIRADSPGLPPRALFIPAGGGTPTDLTLGEDDVLYVALGGAVHMQDRRGRWAPVDVSLAGFEPWRLAAAAGGGVWVLERGGQRMARVRGLPLRRPPGPRDPDVVRPCTENPDPSRLEELPGPPATGSDRCVALAAGPDGQLGCLVWRESGDALLVVRDGSGWLPTVLAGVRRPYSLGWMSPRRIAVLLAVPDLGEAIVFETGTAEAAAPAGEFHPLRDHDRGPFLHAPAPPVLYGTGVPGHRPLHALSLPAYATRGTVANAKLVDSGQEGTEWHRLYLEARLPPGTGVLVRVAATDAPAPPAEGEADAWHPHLFGALPPAGAGEVEAGVTPRGSWRPAPSELPHHPGLLRCAPVPGEAGLFEVLVQRAGRRVRTLRGRYLWVRMALHGNARRSPEVSALRAYAYRFGYAERLLPEMYRECLFGPDADAAGAATPADFLGRFLGIVEGVMTPLEDAVAHADLLTDPRTVPEGSLDWLGGWIGLTFDPGCPPGTRRALLAAAPWLRRWHGTLRGLQLALEVFTGGRVSRPSGARAEVTGGGVTGGEVVVLEDFRLRRTFATILGADLRLLDDPLLVGAGDSGNSYVGDTLFLGDESRREFLALFGADLPVDTDERSAIEGLFERLAHRVTVLVHDRVSPQDLGVIRRVVERETPAHVQARVMTATRPFLVGLASLTGVDSYLAPAPARRPVRVGESHVGAGDFVQGAGGFDPRRDTGSRYDRAPVARAPGVDAELGDGFTLDARGSTAAAGRELVRYVWRLDQPRS